MNMPESGWQTGEMDTPLHALARGVEARGDQMFLRFGTGDTYSYNQVDMLATRQAHALADLGIKAGDRVVTFLDSSIDPIACWFGINKLGAIWVPINTAYKGEILRHQIADAGGRLVIVADTYLDRVLQIADQLPAVELILVQGTCPANPDCPIPIQSLDDHRGANETPIALTAKPADLCCLMYTSGTTGPSKGCMISHNYMCSFGYSCLESLPLRADDVMWTSMPLFHSGALCSAFMPVLLSQAAMSIEAQFSVSRFWTHIEQSGATTGLLAALAVALIARAPDDPVMLRNFGRLRAVCATPVSPDVRQIWRERFGLEYMTNGYGQTEGAKITTSIHGEPEPPAASSGKANAFFDVMIFDDDDNPVPPNTPGELVFRPKKPHIMFEGYWNRPDATAEAWRNLWMHSGDLGRIDEDGYFYFIDRKKDSLRSRGENISSFEIESAFMMHPAIDEAAVHTVGLDDSAEDHIKVTATLVSGMTISEEELCRWSLDNLPYFAVPRFFEFRAELVKNPTGRVLKYQLRDEGCTAATWDREAAGIKVRRR